MYSREKRASGLAVLSPASFATGKKKKDAFKNKARVSTNHAPPTAKAPHDLTVSHV